MSPVCPQVLLVAQISENNPTSRSLGATAITIATAFVYPGEVLNISCSAVYNRLFFNANFALRSSAFRCNPPERGSPTQEHKQSSRCRRQGVDCPEVRGQAGGVVVVCRPQTGPSACLFGRQHHTLLLSSLNVMDLIGPTIRSPKHARISCVISTNEYLTGQMEVKYIGLRRGIRMGNGF